MANSLIQKKIGFIQWVWLVSFISIWIAACSEPASVEKNQLSIPEREETIFITDQAAVAGKTLFLWQDDNVCLIQINKNASKKEGEKRKLTPTAPCYFVKSPGSGKTQIFRQDKTTRVLAVVGTPVGPVAQSTDDLRCGREVQGILVDHRGKVRQSERILSGSVYCAERGLDNFQYSLFHDS